MEARLHCDIAISMDCDGQDDINCSEQMVDEYLNGKDIVYGVRSDRKSDSGFKRTTAECYYSLLRTMGTETIPNHADYRLMSKRAVEGLFEFGEVNVFLRGIVPQIGYPSAIVEYKRNERLAGESKYPLKKMVAFAFDGITSFSIKPLRVSLVLGIIAFIVAVIILIYCVVQFFIGNTVSGWASLSVSLWGLGGMQLLMLGIVGEYIGKIYLESKHRPKFIIQEILFKEF
jgi:hypothetical protein